MAKIHVTKITTSSVSLGMQASLSGLDQVFDTDFVLNVSRRQETVLYRAHNKQTAHIAAVESKQPLSGANLHIADRSSAITANRIVSLDEPLNAQSVIDYTVPTDKFLVTDVYAAEDNSNSSPPLFYKHLISKVNLPRDDDSDAIDTDYLLTSAELLDINFAPIATNSLRIDYDTGTIFNNLISSFDQETGVAIAYYVRYSIKNPAGSILSYTELVSNEAIFVPAQPEDLDAEMKIIDDGRQVYLIEEHDNSLKVILPHTGNYSFQLLEDAKLQLLPPPEADIEDPWYVSVTNGKFSIPINGIQYQYAVNEFSTQAWDPYAPLKTSQFENSNFVSDKLAKLNRSSINLDPTQSGHVSLLIYDSEDTPLAAFTTDSGRNGMVSENSELYQMWSNTERTGIRSVDGKAGLVDIDGFKLRSDYRIIGSYSYNEIAYEVTQLDFNPFRNPDLRAKVASFFIKPTAEGETKTDSVYFVVSDFSGKIVYSNIPEFTNIDQKIKTSDDIWRNAYIEEVPSYVTTDTGNIKFVPTYTVVGSGLYLPLGDVSVSEDSSPDHSTTFDTRIRGGGVKETDIGIARYLQREAKWYWDMSFWDGAPYPGTANYFIEVPVEILEVAGGAFKTDQVRDVINRHTAGGVYPIAKAYGIDPVISGVTIGNASVEISWGPHGL